MEFSREIEINGRKVGYNHPVYFVADIAANHDGDLERAKDLIYQAAESGSNAAKFQHFNAATIVSDYGFKALGEGQSHQALWDKSVFETYSDASISLEWTPILKETCEKAGIAFFTSPYALDLIDHVDRYVCAYKVGSGDITWLTAIECMAAKKKPMLIATGAATLDEVAEAVDISGKHNPQLILMQCNTNYTGSLENFRFINLKVLKTYQNMFPEVILGLSDHTPGHTTVLGAIALGAKVIEKHFTDDNDREGPDHKFAMNPISWREMVDRSVELQMALGCGIKKIETNEESTVVLQRRSIRARKNIVSGSVIKKDDIEMLRPCPADGIPPHEVEKIIGKVVLSDVPKGQHIRWGDLGSSK